MNNILVTGGAGFIGSHTVLLLLEKGFEVFIIDSFITSKTKVLNRILEILRISNIEAKERLHILKGDLRNKSDIDEIFNFAKNLRKPGYYSVFQ